MKHRRSVRAGNLVPIYPGPSLCSSSPHFITHLLLAPELHERLALPLHGLLLVLPVVQALLRAPEAVRDPTGPEQGPGETRQDPGVHGGPHAEPPGLVPLQGGGVLFHCQVEFPGVEGGESSFRRAATSKRGVFVALKRFKHGVGDE